MAKSNKDVDRRTTFKRDKSKRTAFNPGSFEKPKFLQNYRHPDHFEEVDDYLPDSVPGKNPCGWGSFYHSLKSMTGRK